MIYFDNAATTKPSEGVIKKLSEELFETYGNPATGSPLGRSAEAKIKEAAKLIGRYLGAQGEEIFFTSGGTESDNWAIYGAAQAKKRTARHIISSVAEHDAVLKPLEVLAQKGFEVELLGVDSSGRISLKELEEAIRPDTALVSIMAQNNETGVINPLAEIGSIIKELNPKTLFHTDAVQGFGKSIINVNRAKIDLLSISGHKLHAPKGSGALYIRKGTRILPLIIGGGQQRGFRAGTENPPMAVSLAEAAREAYENFDLSKILKLKQRLWEDIKTNIPDAVINGAGIEYDSPYVLNISIPGIRSEVLLNSLFAKNVIASAGSACHSKKDLGSSVLKSMGLSNERIGSAIRFSFCKYNTLEEVQEAARIFIEQAKILKSVNI